RRAAPDRVQPSRGGQHAAPAGLRAVPARPELGHPLPRPLPRSSDMNRRILALVGSVALLAVACKAAPYDYTGDQKADPVYVDSASYDWFRAGDPTPLFDGQSGDVAASGDYDGTGTWEPAVL